MKDSNHSCQHGATLLSYGREIAANDTESRGSLIAAKGARNLLLDFDHSQISFRKVVRKRHREIIQSNSSLRSNALISSPSSSSIRRSF